MTAFKLLMNNIVNVISYLSVKYWCSKYNSCPMIETTFQERSAHQLFLFYVLDELVLCLQ